MLAMRRWKKTEKASTWMVPEKAVVAALGGGEEPWRRREVGRGRRGRQAAVPRMASQPSGLRVRPGA